MNAVLTTPEASPAWSGATPLIAARRIGLNAIPAPIPTAIVAGRMSIAQLPSTGVRASKRSASVISARPVSSGGLIPKRITSRSESRSEDAPQMIVPGRYARPTSSGVYSSTSCR